MARITKKQEFDELSQFGCAFLQTNNYGGYCIVVDDDGGTGIVARLYQQKRAHGTTMAAHQIHLPA